MKNFVMAAVMSVITAMPASAAEYNFIGYWLVTAKSGTCNNYDPVGDRGVARYRYEIPTNPNREDHILTIFKQNNAQGYRLETGYFNSAWKVVDTIYVGGVGGPTIPWRMSTCGYCRRRSCQPVRSTPSLSSSTPSFRS